MSLCQTYLGVIFLRLMKFNMPDPVFHQHLLSGESRHTPLHVRWLSGLSKICRFDQHSSNMYGQTVSLSFLLCYNASVYNGIRITSSLTKFMLSCTWTQHYKPLIHFKLTFHASTVRYASL